MPHCGMRLGRLFRWCVPLVMHLRACQQPRFLCPCPPRNTPYQTETRTPSPGAARFSYIGACPGRPGPTGHRPAGPKLHPSCTDDCQRRKHDFRNDQRSRFSRVTCRHLSRISPNRACHLLGAPIRYSLGWIDVVGSDHICGDPARRVPALLWNSQV